MLNHKPQKVGFLANVFAQPALIRALAEVAFKVWQWNKEASWCALGFRGAQVSDDPLWGFSSLISNPGEPRRLLSPPKASLLMCGGPCLCMPGTLMHDITQYLITGRSSSCYHGSGTQTCTTYDMSRIEGCDDNDINTTRYPQIVKIYWLLNHLVWVSS